MENPTPGPGPSTGRRAADRRLRLWLILLLVLLALSLAWTLTPLRELLGPAALAATVGFLEGSPWGPWVAIGGFVAGGLLALPVTLMVVLTLVAFGPVAGFAYALAGASVSALVGFALGRVLGHRALARWPESRVHALSQRLGEAGVIVIAAARMVPLAHFTVVSLAAGASHIRAASFLAGTVLGMAPGMAVLALLIDRVVAVSVSPGPRQYLLLAAASLAMLALLLGARLLARRVRRWLPRRRRLLHQADDAGGDQVGRDDVARRARHHQDGDAGGEREDRDQLEMDRHGGSPRG